MIDAADFDKLKVRMKAILSEDLSLARVHEEEGDLCFYYERVQYILVFHGDDPSFIRLVAPQFYCVEAGDSEGLIKAQRAAVQVGGRLKGTKIISGCFGHDDHDFSSTVEPVLSDIASLDADLIERYLSMVRSGMREFCDLMEEPHTPKEAVREKGAGARGLH